MRTMSRSSVLALFWAKRSELQSTEEAVLAVYAAGQFGYRRPAQQAERTRRKQAVGFRARPLIKSVAERNGVSIEAITGPGAYQSIVRVRDEVCWVLRRSGFSYPEIGIAVNRDHTSVMAAVRRFEARLAGAEAALKGAA